MPAPSQLAIATSVLNRLVKEESSYHKELEQQKVKIGKLEAGEGADDENAEYILRQHVSDDISIPSSIHIFFVPKHWLTFTCRSKPSSRPRPSSQA